MKDTLAGIITSMARWPLLLGAVICYGLAIYEETINSPGETAVAIAGTTVGSVLLGAWLVSYTIAGERRHRLLDERAQQERRTTDRPPPMPD